MAGDPRFHAVLKELADLHDQKQQDYGAPEDPFHNVRSTEEFGVPAWMGAMIRLNDKVKRLQSYARKGELANEGVVDSFRDIAVYAIIAEVLWREDQTSSFEDVLEQIAEGA